MLELVVGLIIGADSAAGGAYLIFKGAIQRATAAKNLDYKERWLAAVSLLGSEGALSDEQIQQITAGASGGAAAVSTDRPLLRKGPGFSSDRADIEVARAKAGLPPQDNLKGMFSSDIRRVEIARAKHGTG